MDAAEYKHVVLGLVFLKYVSDAFEERCQRLLKETSDPKSEYYVREPEARYEIMENRDEYLAENISRFLERLAGRICKATPSSPPSASSSMTPW